MLDIRFVREHVGLARASLERRQDPEKIAWLDDLLEEDAEWRKLLQETEQLRNRRNVISREINEAKKEGKDIAFLLEEAKRIPGTIKSNEARQAELQEQIRGLLLRIPNILHESVPFGKDDSENVVIKKFGKPRKFDFEVKHHGQLAVAVGCADFERAVKVAGTGFFYLKGALALLDLALQRFAVDSLMKKGFTLVQAPHLLKREAYEGVVSLDDFEQVMYKVDGSDSFLIATSEHPLVSMYHNDILDEAELPIKFAGISPCYRREIGKHGLDERGFFRVHQFNKVEQIVFCKPEDSWKFFEEIRRNSEELMEKLGLPYETTNICTGDIGIIAAKKYDINGWSPREQKYFELMSCSNCTSYQAVRANIKYRKKDGSKEFVHTLNNTAIATTRMLRCIIENYQTKDGTIIVPKALRPYMNGIIEIGAKPKKALGKKKQPRASPKAKLKPKHKKPKKH